MKTVSVADAKADLSAYVRESEHGPVVITRNDRPVAVLLGIANEEELERLVLAHTPKFKEILDVSRAQIRNGEHLSHAELWAAMDAEQRE